MAFIPYRKITIETHLNRAEAIDRFRKAIFTELPHPIYFRGPRDYLVDIELYPQFLGAFIVAILFLASLFALFIDMDMREWLVTGHLYYQGFAFVLIAFVAYSLLVASFDPELERISTFLSDLYRQEDAQK